MFFSRSEDRQYNAIKFHIAKFDAAWNDLKNFDLKVGGFGGTSSLLWLVGICGTGTYLLSLLGIYIYNQQSERNKLVAAFQTELKTLLSDYHQLTKLGPLSTNDKLTIEVLEKIAPFIKNLNDLVPWDLERSADRPSREFIKILSQPPHRRTFIYPSESKKESYFFNNFATRALTSTWSYFTNRNHTKLEPSVTVSEMLKDRMSNIPTEDLKYYLYGYDSRTRSKPRNN